MTSAADRAQLEHILRAGSRTFFFASRALPRRMREPTLALYAFCRKADDSVDDVRSSEAAHAAVAALRARIERVYSGAALDDVVERCFARTVHELGIPRRELDLLAEGMQWDAEGRRYQTLDEVRAYALRVAGTVGVMMTHLMGPTDPAVLERARDLGIGMQLTNIARDVGADARVGRLYLPLEWLEESNLDPDAFLQSPTPSAAVRSNVERLLRAADVHYARADEGIAHLPRDCRIAIRAARLIYADIGRVIERRAHDSVTARAVVSTRRKLWLLARAAFALSWRPMPLGESS